MGEIRKEDKRMDRNKKLAYAISACKQLWDTFDELSNLKNSSKDKRVLSTAKTYMKKELDEIVENDRLILKSVGNIKEVISVDDDFFSFYFVIYKTLLEEANNRGLKTAKTMIEKRLRVHLEDAGFNFDELDFNNLEVM